MKLLVVDDDEFLRDMYVTKFIERGDEVLAATDGASALAQVDKEKFDVILLDMVLPNMTGIDLLRQIKDRAPETTCIMLSNQSDYEVKEAAEAAGAAGYVVKADMVPSEVVDAVNTIINDKK